MRRKMILISFAVVATVSVLTFTADSAEADVRTSESIEIPVIVNTGANTETLQRTVDFTLDAEDTYISEEIQNACIEIGDKNGYCPALLMAIIESESSGIQYAENGPCKGLMQINMSNSDVTEYMDEQGYTDIFDIYTNIEIGCYVLDRKREIYGDDLYAVLMAYNGSSNVWERMENENYTEYADRIVKRSWELERLHGK